MEELQPSLTTVAIADMMSELEQIVKQNKLQAAIYAIYKQLCQFGEWGECPSIPQITQPQELVPLFPANDIKRLKKQVLDLKSVKTSLQHESRLIAKENQILQVIHI